MTDAFVLHLNGGPKDDETFTTQMPWVDIAGLRALELVNALEATAPTALPFRVGRYVARRDVLGQFVPHDLSGAIEADWQGWDS